MDAEEEELLILEDEAVQLFKELSVLECTERTIDRFEKDYSIEPDTSLSIEQRRLRILAKKYQKMLPTRQVLEAVLKRMLSASAVKIEESTCNFNIYVETMKLLGNLEIAKDFFRRVRPAHFDYHFINAMPRKEAITLYIGCIVCKHKKIKVEVAV